MRNVNLVSYPQLIRLLMDGESLKELIQLKPEELLLRW